MDRSEMVEERIIHQTLFSSSCNVHILISYGLTGVQPVSLSRYFTTSLCPDQAAMNTGVQSATGGGGEEGGLHTMSNGHGEYTMQS